jgi:uncharacterized protein (DUF4213/DUF364 family)
MTFNLKSAKFFLGLGAVFDVVSLACGVATIVQFVRGFFDHSQLAVYDWLDIRRRYFQVRRLPLSRDFSPIRSRCS